MRTAQLRHPADGLRPRLIPAFEGLGRLDLVEHERLGGSPYTGRRNSRRGRPGGFRHFGVWLSRVVLTLGCVAVFAGVVTGQSEPRALPIGVEAITRVLTGHEQWTLYWDRAKVSRPRLGSATADRSCASVNA
jgi:hypothetical protein